LGIDPGGALIDKGQRPILLRSIIAMLIVTSGTGSTWPVLLLATM
jgi:hypothetical protein